MNNIDYIPVIDYTLKSLKRDKIIHDYYPLVSDNGVCISLIIKKRSLDNLGNINIKTVCTSVNIIEYFHPKEFNFLLSPCSENDVAILESRNNNIITVAIKRFSANLELLVDIKLNFNTDQLLP